MENKSMDAKKVFNLFNKTNLGPISAATDLPPVQFNMDNWQKVDTTLATSQEKCMCLSSVGFTLLIFSIVLMIVDPLPIAKRFCTKLNDGSVLYNIINKEVEGVTIKIYLFNITNAEEFTKGYDHKLRLKEVGPFVYRQVRVNKNMSIDDEKHILKYIPSSSNTFDPENSIGDPSSTRLYLPNIPLLLSLSKISNQSWFIKYSFRLLATRYRSAPILNITVQEYLWGYDDPLIKFGNTVVPGVFHFEKLGLLDRFFDPKNNLPLEVDTTDENKFEIKKMDGLEGLNSLGFSQKRTYCNSFNNTFEGIMFPYNISPQRTIREYHNIYCRILDLEYFKNETMEYGSQALVYRITKNAFDHNLPENECICPYGGCVNGVSDLSTCFYGLPLGLSLAHFLYADEKIFERIEGLTPNESIHGSEFHVDKDLGLSLATKFSIQYNLMLSDVSYYSGAEQFANMVLPFIWIQVVQPPLPNYIVIQLQLVYIYMPKIIIILQILFIFAGCSIIVYYAFSAYRQKVMQRHGNKMDYDIIYHKTTMSIINTEQPLLKSDERQM